MQPKTQEEKEVVRYHNLLPELSFKQLEWVVFQDRERMERKYHEAGDKRVYWDNYYTIVTTFRGWQVLRHIICTSEYGKRIGYRVTSLLEFSQRWLRVDEAGKCHLQIFEMQKQMHWYAICQPYCGALALRHYNLDPYSRGGRTHIASYDHDIYPVRRFAESIVRNGLENLMGREDIIDIVSTWNEGNIGKMTSRYTYPLDASKREKRRLVCYLPTQVETLFKMGEERLAREAFDGRGGTARIMKYWKPFLVAHRRGYRPNWNMWFDYLSELSELGKDIHNPAIICPDNLNEAHAKTTEKVAKARAAKRLAEDIERAKIEEVAFHKEKQPYFGLAFVAKDFKIEPLRSVAEFAAEGNAMHHCVFTGRYYTHKDALILSARDKDGARLETIEVSLNTYKIVQSRAACNGVTPYHNKIAKVINSHMDEIRAIRERCLA